VKPDSFITLICKRFATVMIVMTVAVCLSVPVTASAIELNPLSAKPLTIATNKSIAKLKTPTLVSVANTAAGVQVKWKKAAKAKGYKLYRKTSGSSWSLIATVKGVGKLSYTDKKVASGKGYSYRVKAFSGKKLSTASKTKYIKYLGVPKLSAAENVIAGVQVNWGKVAGAGGYKVYRKTAGGNYIQLAIVAGKATIKYVDSTALGGKTYTYTVRAYSNKTTGAYETKGRSILRKVWVEGYNRKVWVDDEGHFEDVIVGYQPVYADGWRCLECDTTGIYGLYEHQDEFNHSGWTGTNVPTGEQEPVFEQKWVLVPGHYVSIYTPGHWE
jgi:hypothetical protein